MAAATQTARTSPPNSKMSSPKDSKGALPVVTKTEGELLHCPAQTQPSCPVAGALSPLPFTFQAHVAPACVCVCSCARITSSCRTYPLGEPLLTMSIPEPAEVNTDTKDIRKYPLLNATSHHLVACRHHQQQQCLWLTHRVATVSEPVNADAKPATTNAAPLAPPPKPTTTGDTPDYFNTVHNPFSLEPNVFEQSFGGNGSVETPGGRPILPPVANITSPSPLPGITPGWQSLRAGPLSPAMLSGPTGQTDYFSESFRGFPTPNESSLRTGLTPGGGGSMFPAPSPNTQAIFNLQSAGVTPGTGDFQQAALRAAAQANQNKTTGAPTSQPDTVTAGMDRQNNYQQAQQQQRSQNDPYANHDVSSAANDLLSFASQNGGGARSQPPFSMAPNNQSANAGHMPVQPVGADHSRRNTKGSINSIASADTGDFSESGQSEQNKSTRARGKKGAANGKQAAGTKRKADDAPKGGRKKGAAASMDDEDDSDDEQNVKEEEFDSKGRKMTDEEKRKNFLERNRYVLPTLHVTPPC